MKKILAVSHCILNTASKVVQDEAELEEEYRVKNQLLRLVLDKNIQLLQLPCPEFQMYGSQRWGHVKDQFQHPHFREESRKMLENILLQLEEYLAHPEDFQVMGIVSVEGSPSCGYHLTCAGQWGGEIGTDPEAIAEIQKRLEMKNEPGVFMQILQEELIKRGLQIPVITMAEAAELLAEN